MSDVPHSYRREKQSSSKTAIDKYMAANGARQLGVEDNSGLVCRFYSNSVKAQLLADQKQRIAGKAQKVKS
jgi:hypothetical protein